MANTPPALANLLNRLLAAETHGLLARAGDLEPHLTPRTYKTWRRVLELSHLCQEHNQALADMLKAMRVDPTPAVSRVNVADYHYLDVPHILPELAAETRAQVDLYRQAVAAAAAGDNGDPDLRQELQDLMDENADHLAELERMIAQ